jgi:hypothetical protein
MLSSQPLQDQRGLPTFPTATNGATPSSLSQQSDTFQLSESFENQLCLEQASHKALGIKKQNSIKGSSG